MENIPNYFLKNGAFEEKYKLDWTIERFSRLPLEIEVKSSKIILGDCEWHASVTIYDSYVELQLFRASSYGAFQIVSGVKVLDCNGKMYYENTATVSKDDKEEAVSLRFLNIESTILNELKLVPNDTWYCTFIIKTYRMYAEKIYGVSPLHKLKEKTENSFCANFWNMFENKIGTDVTLQVEDDKIEAHKLVLSAQSPVFAKMFEIPMSESEKNTVVIDDVSMTAMTLLVEFLYSKIEIIYYFDTALELYYAADKYEVFQLRDLCGEILISNLEESNAGVLLEMADKHKDVSLKFKVLSFINSNLHCCVKEDWWNELTSKKTELAKQIIRFI